jgi:ABC-type antimicrobial peptide transport system permease subunit
MTWLRDVLEPQVYGVSTMDPLVIGASIAVVTLIVALASVAPARRVTRVTPVTVLEQE